MTDLSSGGATTLTPSQDISPNESQMFVIGYNENTVIVQNDPDPGIDGEFIYVWLYADVNSVTPVLQPIPSGGSNALNPSLDSSGNRAQVLVIMNTGQATLQTKRR